MLIHFPMLKMQHTCVYMYDTWPYMVHVHIHTANRPTGYSTRNLSIIFCSPVTLATNTLASRSEAKTRHHSRTIGRAFYVFVFLRTCVVFCVKVVSEFEFACGVFDGQSRVRIERVHYRGCALALDIQYIHCTLYRKGERGGRRIFRDLKNTMFQNFATLCMFNGSPLEFYLMKDLHKKTRYLLTRRSHQLRLMEKQLIRSNQ